MKKQLKQIFVVGGIVFGSVTLAHASELNYVVSEESQASDTISVKGIVTGAADNYIYIRNEEGRQIIVQTEPDTKIEEPVKRGDWIEAKMLPNDHATSIRKVESPGKK